MQLSLQIQMVMPFLKYSVNLAFLASYPARTISIIIIWSFTLGIPNTQAQILWDDPISVAPPSLAHNWPRIAVDAKGDPIMIWGNAGRVMFARWTGNGFSTPVQVSPSGMSIAEAGWMGPEMAAHGDTMYVVFKETPENQDGKSIWCVHSYDGGMSWSEAAKVDRIGTDRGRFPVVTTDAEGHPVVGFMRFDAQFREPRWVMARSHDHGRTFEQDVLASGWSGPKSEVCDCCPGSMDSNGEMVALFYRDNLNDLRECWVGLSDDKGNTVSRGLNMDGTGWMINSCPSSAIDGVILGDSVYAAFMSGAEGAARVYFSRAGLGSAGAAGIQMLREQQDVRFQNYPKMAGYGKALAFVWSQYSSDRQLLPIAFSADITSGSPILIDTAAYGNIENADIAMNGDRIMVAWKDNGTRNLRFRSGRYAQATGMETKLHIPGFSVFPNPGSNGWNISGSYTGKELSIAILDTGGTLLQTFKMEDPGTFQLWMDNTALPMGTYFLRLSDMGRQITLPIMK